MGAVDQAYAMIRGAIMDGRFAPGSPLREEELARIVSVSRTPVREALRRLHADGLIVFHPNRGARVPEWTPQERNDAYGLRTVLEPYAARLAAERIEEPELTELDDLAEEMLDIVGHGSNDQFVRIAVLNNRFHEIVLTASRNPRLLAITTGLVHLPVVVEAYNHASLSTSRLLLTQHRDLVTALRVRNAEWASAVMRAHIEAGWYEARKNDDDGQGGTNGGHRQKS